MTTRTPKERAAIKAAKAERWPGKAKGRGPKKEKPKKPKVPSVAVLDDLFSRYIRLRAANECQLWGYGGVKCSTQMQASHIKSRRFTSLRWHPMNCICACAAHHRAQHDHPDQNRLWLAELLGEEHLEQLQCMFLNGKKPTPAERIEIAKFLRGKLLEADPFG
jgi:hypothetical protein